LLGDKSHSMIFDNTKIRKSVPDFNPAIPFREGAKEIIAWYNAHTRQREPDKEINQFMDRITNDYLRFVKHLN